MCIVAVSLQKMNGDFDLFWLPHAVPCFFLAPLSWHEGPSPSGYWLFYIPNSKQRKGHFLEH